MWNTILWVLGVICAVWVIYDVFAVNKRLSTNMKIVWTVFAIIFSIITAIVYWFVYKK